MSSKLLSLIAWLVAGALIAIPTGSANAQSVPIVTAGFVSGADGSHATVHIVKHSDGGISGGGMWLYSDATYDLFVSVDQAFVGADGISVYYSGWLDSPSGRFRYIGKLIDNGEGKKASGPDKETYLVISTDPTWNLSSPNALYYLDTPSLWGLSDWFPIAAGNIQVRAK